MSNPKNKPIIETMLNTAALAISSFGVVEITQGKYYGFLCVIFAAALEWFKYYGRHKDIW